MNRKYQVNTTPFENVDSELKAYCLGVLSSCGRVIARTNRVVVRVHLERKHLLYILRSLIGPDASVYEVAGEAETGFYSKELVNHLLSIGLGASRIQVSRHIATLVPLQLRAAFLRGMVDSVGTIECSHHNTYGRLVIRIPIYCKNVIEWLPIGKVEPHKTHLIWYPKRMSTALQDLSYLYENCTISLEKHAKMFWS